jgi:quercetin dioxygenase-like cupin family protein
MRNRLQNDDSCRWLRIRSPAESIVTNHLLQLIFGFSFAGALAAQEVSTPAIKGTEPLKVDTKGVTTKILYEAPINGGHLPKLNAKYKLRVTEITIARGGYVGDHNHVGPGIRQMTVGEMEYITPHRRSHTGPEIISLKQAM